MPNVSLSRRNWRELLEHDAPPAHPEKLLRRVIACPGLFAAPS